MKRIQNRLYHPLFVVPSSVFLSLTAYIIAHYIIHWEHFWVGFFLSVLIPLMVSLPIALLMDGYFKKINKQKIELERLDSANKKLFALISHDVRAPLDSLKGMIELVVNETIDLEESKLYFDKLSNKLEHLNIFLDGLLDWSKRQTQNKPLEFSSFDSNEVIKPIIDLLEPLAQDKDITIITKNTKNKIHSDLESYSFVFRNILHNAIKFTPKSGAIQIQTITKNGKTHTSIKDSGVGISKKEINKILEGDNWYTTKGTSEENGTGFGLRTCIYYLEKNNGELLIESEEGNGTAMTIILPQGKV
tara:strand:+ start:47014 stop:47925 length:912 start_codon:yes stop_codon:yes gene_type:complete